MWQTNKSYDAFSPIPTSFDESEKFRAVIYPNFEVLLKEKYDLIPEKEYAALISMDNTKK